MNAVVIMIAFGTVLLILLGLVAYLLWALRHALKKTRESVRRDDLTGVFNGRAFRELSEMEMLRSQRYRHSFTLAYLDIDDFKKVNDRFGHSVGDAVLRLVTRTIRDNTRSVDLLARLGGDEFALLLPETGYEPAKFVLRRIQESLASVMERNKWPLTFSFGAVTFPEPPSSVDAILQEADRLLSDVKKRGKNGIAHKSFDTQILKSHHHSDTGTSL